MASLTRSGMKSTPLQLAAAAIAAGFLAVGALGFVPGVIDNYDQLELAGHDSRAELFGLFQISVLHNIVHLAFGVIGLTMASTAATARSFLIGGGVIYLALWVYGLVVGASGDANFVPLNAPDDWLHFGLGAGMLVLGATFAGPGRSTI